MGQRQNSNIGLGLPLLGDVADHLVAMGINFPAVVGAEGGGEG